MKKKTLLLSSSILAAIAVVGTASAVLGVGGKIGKANTNADEYTYHHYKASDADYLKHGSKEYWISCDDPEHTILLEEPKTGTILEEEEINPEVLASLTDEDPRYEAKLVADHYVEISPNTIQSATGKHSFITKTGYTNIQSLEFEMRLKDFTITGTNDWSGWTSFGFTTNPSNADIYMPNIQMFQKSTLSKYNDGEWHTLTLDFSAKETSESTYLAFVCAVGEFGDDSRIQFKNFKLTTSNGSYTDDVKGVSKLFKAWGLNSEYPDYPEDQSIVKLVSEGVDTKDRCIKLDMSKYSATTGKMNIQSAFKIAYMENVSFDYKFENLSEKKEGVWKGFGFAEDVSTADIYTGMETGLFTDDGGWHTFTKRPDTGATAKFFYFIEEVGQFNEGSIIYIDNIKYNTYWDSERNLYVDDCNTDCPFLNTTDDIINGAWTTVVKE